MGLPSSPNNRKEVYLSNIAGQGTSLPSEPITREEEYLDFIAKNGGGGGGTGDGDMKKSVYDDDMAVAGAGGIADYVASAITGKVDKVIGKGLSTNDYDNTAKGIVDGVNTALDGKVSKSNTAGLLKNDGTVDQTSYATAASVTAIKDGTTIDSFGDVESALADKVSKSETAGLLKNDGTVDTSTYLKNVPFGTTDQVGGYTYDDTQFYISTVGKNELSLIFGLIQENVSQPPSAGDVYNAVKSAYDLTKDTVGWSGKNFNKGDPNYVFVKSTARTHSFQFAKNVTQGKKYTVSFDVSAISGYTGSIALGVRFIGSDTTHDWSVPTSASGRISHTFTASSNAPVGETNSIVYMFISSSEGNGATITVSNLMFTDADVLDQTYEPYRGTTAFPRDEQRILGARQLFRMPYYDGTSKVSHNATFTVNADGSITIDTAGQATDADATFRLMRYDRDQAWLDMLNGQTLRISSNSVTGARIQGYWASATHSTNGYEWTVDTTQMTNWNFAIFVPSGTTLSNVTIYPLLCLASDPSDEFSAPALTNRELTEALPSKMDRNPINAGTTTMDNLTESGIYYCTTPSDAPESITYFNIMVMKTSNTSIRQIIFRPVNASGTIYIRGKGSGGWSPWFKFEGTQVVTS